MIQATWVLSNHHHSYQTSSIQFGRVVDTGIAMRVSTLLVYGSKVDEPTTLTQRSTANQQQYNCQ